MRPGFSALSIAAVLAVAAAAPSRGEEAWKSADSALAAGQSLLDAGDLAGAERALAAATGFDPDRAEAWHLFGLAAYRRRDHDPALERLSRAIRLDPQLREALFYRGLLHYSRKRYREALTDFNRTVALRAPEGRITDPDLARRKYQALRSEGESELSFEDAVRRGLLVVDVPAVFGKIYGRLCVLLTRGPGFQRPIRIETEHYEIICDRDEGVARLLSDHLELALASFRETFSPPGDGEAGYRFRVLVFPNHDAYLRYLTRLVRDPSTPRITGGAYHGLTGQLLLVREKDIDRLIRLTYHEGFHQFMHAHFPEMPPWFSEGLAEYFGACRLGDGRLLPGELHPQRLPEISKALDSVRLADLLQADLAGFMVSHDPQLRRRAPRVAYNYAYSWAFVHYLMTAEDGARRGLLAKLLGLRLKGESIGSATKAVFPPESVPDLEAAFRKYAKAHLIPLAK